jgi:hypothetical protein
LAVSLAGCAGSNGKGDVDQTEDRRLPAYFEEIPADTFYFAGGTQPLPTELVASTLSSLETLRTLADALDSEVGVPAHPVDRGDAMAETTDKPPRVDAFLLAKMGDKIDADGLEKLGISKNPYVASYVVGSVPVLRFSLSDEKKFLALVDELEKTYDEPSTKLEHQKVSYRRYSTSRDHLLLRTTADEAVFAVAENDVVELFIPYFTGAKKPKKSLADDNKFERTAETNGFKPFAAGYFDLELMIAYATGNKQPTGVTKAILDKADFSFTQSPECKSEMIRLASMMPRVVAGFREFNKESTEFVFGAELEQQLARDLAGTVVGTPGHSTEFAQKSFIEIGLGLDMGKLVDVAAAEARKIQSKPFQCRELQSYNRTASQILGASGQVPPAVRKLQGFNILLRNLMLDWATGDTMTGKTVVIPRMMGALRTDDPQALLFLVSQLFPMVKQLDAKPDGKPVAIPHAAGAYEGIIDPLLVMTKRGLAMTIGPDMIGNGKSVLGAEASATSPALVIKLNLGDPARQMVASVEKLVDEAAADKKVRGLSDEDITQAREAIQMLRSNLPEGPWAASLSAELNEFGILFVYRDQGELDLDPDIVEKSSGEGFDALRRVLRVPNPMEEARPDEARSEEARSEEARRAQAKGTLQSLELGIEKYRSMQNPPAYPASLEHVEKEVYGNFIPVDPWGQAYIYKRDGDSYELFSKGPDEQAGTADDIEPEAAGGQTP